MSVVIRDKDNGYARLLKNVRTLSGTSVRVGVTDEPHEGSPGMSVADIGAIHEFGLGNNPERSFLRAWVDQNEKGLVAWFRNRAMSILLGKEAWAELLGQRAVQGIRERIRQHIAPELEDATVRRKGGNDTPLVNTEQLINGIQYEVRRGS